MSNIFNINNINDDDINTRLNIDELYESKQKKDLEKLNVYKKVLNRIHNKIRTTNRLVKTEKCCWFVVPEVILGIPCYDQIACIDYIVRELEENGFIVRYNHPNVLFISWSHWIPTYVRNEIKKNTGVEVDGYGNVIKKGKEKEEFSIKGSSSNSYKDNKKDYKDISAYKPSGKFIYDDIFK